MKVSLKILLKEKRELLLSLKQLGVLTPKTG
jgi:hypothetical protein